MIIMLEILKHVVLNGNVCQKSAIMVFFCSKYSVGTVFVLSTGVAGFVLSTGFLVCFVFFQNLF